MIEGENIARMSLHQSGFGAESDTEQTRTNVREEGQILTVLISVIHFLIIETNGILFV